MITNRQREILNLIISLYTRDKMAVGSKTLLGALGVSSATIRNDMKALEDQGLIQKEHVSSGRIPSALGYQYFIENMLEARDLARPQVLALMQHFDGDFHQLVDLLKVATDTLADLTGLTSFALNVPLADQDLSNFNVVVLDAHSVLAVMTLSTGEVRTKQFILPRSMTEGDLMTFRQIVQERLVGKRLLDIHYRLRTEIPQVVGKYIKTSGDMIALFDQVFSDLFLDRLITSGRQYIFEYGSSEVYKILSDDKRLIREIRDLTKDERARAVKFDSAIGNLTLISQKFIIPYRGLGTLAVLGPMEMDYQNSITVIDLIGKILALKLTDYYRYLDGNHYEMY